MLINIGRHDRSIKEAPHSDKPLRSGQQAQTVGRF